MGRHGRFEAIAGADGNELASFLREKLADGAGVSPPYGDTGQYQGSGIDFVSANLGVFVLLIDECFQGFDIDSGIV
jgi:hypothetical protein